MIHTLDAQDNASDAIEAAIAGDNLPTYTARSCNYVLDVYEEDTYGRRVAVQCWSIKNDNLVWDGLTCVQGSERVIDVIRNARPA